VAPPPTSVAAISSVAPAPVSPITPVSVPVTG
jgi:hypothetical protein